MRSATKKRIGKDKDYLAWIASLPCYVCWRGVNRSMAQYMSMAQQIWNGSMIQPSRTEVAHIGERGLSQKCPDRETAPLCGEHHRTGKYSHHRLGQRFWKEWDIDKDKLITELQKRYEESR